jgi:PleD family two-component response regulator
MERSEFASYRILLLGGKTHALTLLRSILSNAGVSNILQVEDTRRAMELLCWENFHAVFFDPSACDDFDGEPFALAARRRETVINPMVPIYAMQERARRRDVEKARDDGVTDVLTTPVSPRTVLAKLKAAPRAFIVSRNFLGPDRRAAARAPWFGPDRRKRKAKKAKVDISHLTPI